MDERSFLLILLAYSALASARHHRVNLESEARPFACGDPTPSKTKLPQYLIIGDSISIGYTPHLIPHINTSFEAQHIKVNGGNSDRGRMCLTEWLGKNHWDFISFNFGLHDIANDTEHLTVVEYTDNILHITKALNSTGAKLLWVDTTPVPDVTVSPGRTDSDVVEYNAAAAKIMAEYNVVTDDLYGWVEAKCGKGYSACPGVQLPKNVHFYPAGYDYLVESLLKSIHALFPPPPPPLQ